MTFLMLKRARCAGTYTAVSLFSGAGLSDLGYERAEFQLIVQSEKDEKRAALAARNFPKTSVVVGDLQKTWKKIVREYRKNCKRELDLLVATPPCQGMSSSNPSRGKVANPDHGTRDRRNLLILAAVPVIRALRPKLVVVENVPQLLSRMVRLRKGGRAVKVVNAFLESVPDYEAFAGIVQMADYGIAQLRRRCIIVLIRKDLPAAFAMKDHAVLPWPKPTHSEAPKNGEATWVSARQWLRKIRYKPLCATSEETSRDPTSPLHQVPFYPNGRYNWIADIPPYSGKTAYENSRCHGCGFNKVPVGRAYCDKCGAPMKNRPHVVTRTGRYRLIRGFLTSYRRINPDRPVPAVTTASSYLGSDYKIHPWENRVLSMLECADLQTVPRFYKWDWALENGYRYLIREVVGEAMPPRFTFLHGRLLRNLLRGRVPPKLCAKAQLR